ncbi:MULTISPECIES: hypothetical protein [Clostridium]|uniref:hypothetical protein n=1 Tax=Clostridium TaxID=1485 RepID=UPI0034A0DB96
MPISIADYLNIDIVDFNRTGAFNSILDVDSKLFIDPALLSVCTIEELKDSYNKIQKRFNEVLILLKHSKNEKDIFWEKAKVLMTFPEYKGLCIGYSSGDTEGNAIGPTLAKEIIRTAKEIIEAGIVDPIIFELMGLYQDDVGADRISDMIAVLIFEDLLSYSERIFKNLNVKTKIFTLEGKKYNLPENPFLKTPIILIPKCILRDLPIATCWNDIDIVCRENQIIRDTVNNVIGDTWKKATSQKVKKRELKHILLEYPDLLQDLITLYNTKPKNIYDFDSDRSGEVIWYEASKESVDKYPLKLDLPNTPTYEDLIQIVEKICNQFKVLIENNGLNSLLYNDETGKPKHEEASQKLFYGIADAYCLANNIDLTRECNAGRGPVDFKLSSGYKSKVLVEIKKSNNSQLIHGIEKQLPEYQKAEKTKETIYLVLDIGNSDRNLKNLNEFINEKSKENIRLPKVIIVDAKKKLSASRY